MTYNPRIATIPKAEFDALMAIVRGVSETQRPLSDDDRWRRDYRRDQDRLRIAGRQEDLLGAPAITHFHRHARGPGITRVPEPTDTKLERIQGDPLATFGPLRADRPALLSRDERAAIVRRAANWLRLR